MLKDKSSLENFDLVKELDNEAAEVISGGYAAIAATLGGIYGYRYGAATREIAGNDAVANCRSFASNPDDCILMWRGDQDCGAVANGFGTLTSGRGSSQSNAESDALSTCRSHTSSPQTCSIVYSLCGP